MGRIIVCRHGNTFDKGDVVTRVGGRTDLPLSTSGKAQADALARHFADTPFQAAYCSTLQRTRETAAAILSARADGPDLSALPFLPFFVASRLGSSVRRPPLGDATPRDKSR